MNQQNHSRGPYQGNKQYDNRPPRIDYQTMTEYYDAQNVLKREVFIDWAKQIAESLGDTRTSLRRIYDNVAALRFRIRMKNEEPAQVLQPGLGMLHRYAEYQKGRGVIKFGTCKFIQDNCKEIGSDPAKFEGFYQLFQSVMSYLKRR